MVCKGQKQIAIFDINNRNPVVQAAGFLLYRNTINAGLWKVIFLYFYYVHIVEICL